MADNDRLAKGGNLSDTPGWKTDEKDSVMIKTPLLTKDMGGIGWNTSGKTRQVVTKNADGVPEWRNRVFVPGNLVLVTVDPDATDYVTIKDYLSGNPIPSGSYVDKGTKVIVEHHLDPLGTSKPYGGWITIQGQETTDKYWATNYEDYVNLGHYNFYYTIQEDIIVSAEVKERVTATFASEVKDVITVTCACISWGARGAQVVSLTLTNEFQSLESMEVFKGDELITNYFVDSAYDWADFKVGASASEMYDVKPEVDERGGSYEFKMENSVTYIGMTALIPTNFYIYQPRSSDFTQCVAEVTNVTHYRIHKEGVKLPEEGERIDFGRNGAVGNHPALYPGTIIKVFAEAPNTYIAEGFKVSDEETTPEPSLPSSSTVGTYYEGVSLTVHGTPILAIGLYWIKPGVNLFTQTAQAEYIKDSYDTYDADENGRLNNALKRPATVWPKPSGVVAAWLQNINWSFSQASEKSAADGSVIELPYSEEGDLGDVLAAHVENVENPLFIYDWGMVVNSMGYGEGFFLSVLAYCMNYEVGAAPGQQRDPYAKVVTSWTFTPIVTICTGAA